MASKIKDKPKIFFEMLIELVQVQQGKNICAIYAI